MSTKSKFTIILVLTSLVGAFVFGLLSYLDSRESLRDAAFEELTAIRTARVQQVGEYFESIFDEASVITENPTVERAMMEFRAAFDALEAEELLSDVPYESELERYYERALLPKLRPLLDQGEIDAATFMPRTEAGRYLQYRYIAENPADYGKGEDLIDTGGGTRYEAVHAQFHEDMRFIRDEFGYYDIFLIDADTGDIVYTVDKESDFATNIYEGPYRSSGLGDLVEEVKDDPTRRAVHFEDLQFYLPSLGEPALFVGSSIHDGDRVIGILAIQLTNTVLNRILTANGDWANVGLKTTGETYVVGPDGTLRNESRFFLESPDAYFEAIAESSTPPDAIEKMRERGTSVLLQRVDTEATREAFRGQSDTRVIADYRGEQVLSAYTPVQIDGNTYAFIAEIDAEEAFKPVAELALRMAVTTAIVIPLTALLGIWVSSLLMRPAREMRATARRFLDGEEEAEFQDQASDEWGQLGQVLNRVLDTAKARLADAAEARGETESMIERLMPYAIGERYAEGEREIVSHAEMASAAMLMISPDAKFNDLSDPARAVRLYGELDDALDQLATEEGVDILNQAGMNYVAFCGLTTPMGNHGERLMRFCERSRELFNAFDAEHGTQLSVRGGLASAPMFGALIGSYSTAYEVWGEAIEQAIALAEDAPDGALVVSGAAKAGSGSTVRGKSVKVLSANGEDLKASLLGGFFGTR